MINKDCAECSNAIHTFGECAKHFVKRCTECFFPEGYECYECGQIKPSEIVALNIDKNTRFCVECGQPILITNPN